MKNSFTCYIINSFCSHLTKQLPKIKLFCSQVSALSLLNSPNVPLASEIDSPPL